jgi:hypothetical protein
MNPAYSPKCVGKSLLSKSSCDYDAAQPNTTSTCSKRCLLRLGEWMSLAVTSPRVPTLENRLPLLPPVEDEWYLRDTQRGVARALANLLRQETLSPARASPSSCQPRLLEERPCQSSSGAWVRCPRSLCANHLALYQQHKTA